MMTNFREHIENFIASAGNQQLNLLESNNV
jgi:hypothetical protein